MSRTTDDVYRYGNHDTMYSWFEYDHKSPYYIPAYNGPPPPSDTHVQYDLDTYKSMLYKNGNDDACYGNRRLDERLVDYGPNADYKGQRHPVQHDKMLLR